MPLTRDRQRHRYPLVSVDAGARQRYRQDLHGSRSRALLVGIVSCRSKISTMLALWQFRALCIDLVCVEAGPVFGILQQIMGGSKGFEASLGPQFIGVSGAHQLATGLLDLVRSSGLGQAKNFKGINRRRSDFSSRQEDKRNSYTVPRLRSLTQISA
jgi:hypothetical protein